MPIRIRQQTQAQKALPVLYLSYGKFQAPKSLNNEPQ